MTAPITPQAKIEQANGEVAYYRNESEALKDWDRQPVGAVMSVRVFRNHWKEKARKVGGDLEGIARRLAEKAKSNPELEVNVSEGKIEIKGPPGPPTPVIGLGRQPTEEEKAENLRRAHERWRAGFKHPENADRVHEMLKGLHSFTSIYFSDEDSVWVEGDLTLADLKLLVEIMEGFKR